VGQLKQLEFLSLKGLKNIHELPEEICNLSSLQFLDLSHCDALQSLPSKIGELKNLKHLSLSGCSNLEVIPHEISQLTSLSALEAVRVKLSLEAESEASIWRLKGFRNLNRLAITVNANLQEEITSSGIKEGIMGTWMEMRHLALGLGFDYDNDVMVDLPHDMNNMRKL
jgi:Leucine-rich repeat (LRR) protein